MRVMLDAEELDLVGVILIRTFRERGTLSLLDLKLNRDFTDPLQDLLNHSRRPYMWPWNSHSTRDIAYQWLTVNKERTQSLK
jgi:hypothetical protein